MMRSIAAMFAFSAAAACATTGAPEARTDDAAPPRAPAFLAADIAGKTGGEIDALLGAADLVRVEGEGEFRRYALAGCALIVILYPDENGARRVRHLDAGALKAGDDKPDLDACLAGGRKG